MCGITRGRTGENMPATDVMQKQDMLTYDLRTGAEQAADACANVAMDLEAVRVDLARMERRLAKLEDLLAKWQEG